MLATVTLENSLSLSGEMFGASLPAWGEIAFYTGMVDYELVFTDLCYRQKIVVMTYPLVGNCGLSQAQMKKKPVIAGLIVADLCHQPRHWGSEASLAEYLQSYDIPGLTGLDTRALLRTVQREGGKKRANIIPAAWTQPIERLALEKVELGRKGGSSLAGKGERQSA